MRWPLFAEIGSILRIHIILIAMTAAITFGWLFSGKYLWWVAALVGLDWLLVNLLNRISDINEDVVNGIRGAGHVARHRRALVIVWSVIQAFSLALGVYLAPALTPWRVAVQLAGVGYSFRVVPTPNGWRRFKDIYFLKNFMSAAAFVATVFAYPLVATRLGSATWGEILILVAFFVPFEMTYEIIYDMRDLDGDAKAAVPTFPVVHGLVRARQIVDVLLATSVLFILVGLGTGALGLREGLLAAAPVVQALLYRPRYCRGITRQDCILLTHAGTAMLLAYLGGTRAWLEVGLPANIYLVGP